MKARAETGGAMDTFVKAILSGLFVATLIPTYIALARGKPVAPNPRLGVVWQPHLWHRFCCGFGVGGDAADASGRGSVSKTQHDHVASRLKR
jgi:hypothetical protein